MADSLFVWYRVLSVSAASNCAVRWHNWLCSHANCGQLHPGANGATWAIVNHSLAGTRSEYSALHYFDPLARHNRRSYGLCTHLSVGNVRHVVRFQAQFWHSSLAGACPTASRLPRIYPPPKGSYTTPPDVG